MSSAFGRASDAYNYGNKSDAKIYSNEGKDYQAQLKSVNAQISRLGQEVKDARAHAEAYGSKADSSGFNGAKNKFEDAKSAHKLIEAKFKSAKAERERLHSEFKALNEEYKQKHRRFIAAKDSNREQKETKIKKVESALVPATGFFDGHAAKIKERNDGSGKTDVYFGGFNHEGDGLFHGHIVIDSNDNVVYYRDQFQEHDDYLIDDRKEHPNHTKI